MQNVQKSKVVATNNLQNHHNCKKHINYKLICKINIITKRNKIFNLIMKKKETRKKYKITCNNSVMH